MSTEPTERQKLNRGFRVMDPERHREIARKGGAAVPNDKRSFSKDHNLAAQAGRKGGAAYRPSVSRQPSRPRPQNDFG